jgi:NAD(P)H-dependent FMN reductase
MPAPKILVISGSARANSPSARLAALAAKELTLADAEVTRISLADYPMPLYDPDAEQAAGPPSNAVKLKRMIAAHQGVFVTTPELNASIPPLLVNTLGWVARVRERSDNAPSAFPGRVFALGAAAPDRYGGLRALMTLRQMLEMGCGALVLPEQITVPAAEEAFDDMDRLRDESLSDTLRGLVRRLVDLAWERALA